MAKEGALKILHTNMHRAWGGQPNRVLTTAIGLRNLGHEVVVSGPRGSMLTQRAADAGFRTFDDWDLRSGLRPASIWRDVKAVREHLRAENYDLVDTHGSQDSWRVHLALYDLGKPPRIVRSRHNIFPVSGNPMNRWLYSKVDHVITVSPQVIPLLSKVMPPERCTSIYSAPDAGRMAVGDVRDDVRAELGYTAENQVIGVVGRLAPEKGHRYLVEAAPRILEAFPSARFIFIGTGRTREDLELQIASLGLSDRFHLTGFREDVPRLLQALDLFVLCPTAGESLGTSILEAFLAGRPVVATDVGGVSESVKEGQTGKLVPPADSEALAVAIRWMLANPADAVRMAAAGKALVEREFTPERIAEQTEAVYRRVLAGVVR